jgi:hypothetical protein
LDFDDAAFFPAFSIEILVQLEAQLADMYANRTIFDNAVILGFAENRAPDPILGQGPGSGH